MGVAAFGRQEYGFDAGELSVHGGHGNFVFEVEAGADAFDDDVSAVVAAEVGEQSFAHGYHGDAAEVTERLGGHGYPVVEGEAIFFGVVGGYGHDDFVEVACRTGDHFHVSVVYGVI